MAAKEELIVAEQRRCVVVNFSFSKFFFATNSFRFFICSFAKKIFVKVFDRTELSSNDFETVEEFDHRLTFSPDKLHSVFVNFLGQGVYSITNPTNIEYNISITRGGCTVASIVQNLNGLTINNQWRIKGKFVFTRPLNANPDIYRSRSLNFEIGDVNRFDISRENESFASILFNDKEIYSVQFNGSESLDGFDEFIGIQCDRQEPKFEDINKALESNPVTKREIVREFMVEFLAADRAEHGECETSTMIQRFAQKIGL